MLGFLSAQNFKSSLNSNLAVLRKTHTLENSPLYLPEGRYIKLLTLGYNNFFSDILWFRTLNYFGKQYVGGKDYRWLYHMCDLVTELNPNATHAYEFCATLLSWEAKDAELSNEILNKAIQNHPEHWRFWYYRGFNYWYFFEDYEKAQKDIEHASKLSTEHPFLASLASKLLVNTSGDINQVIKYLHSMLDASNDQIVSRALTEKLNSALITKDIVFLEEAVLRYEKQNGRLPEDISQLVEDNIITKIPSSPTGSRYILSENKRNITTTKGEEKMKFKGKTARTGIFRQQFGKEKK